MTPAYVLLLLLNYQAGLTVQYVGFTYWEWDDSHWEILVFEHFALSRQEYFNDVNIVIQFQCSWFGELVASFQYLYSFTKKNILRNKKL